MGLIALILSVVVDAIWPLRGRREESQQDAEARDAPSDEAADPLADAPYDPLTDPLADPQSEPLTEPLTPSPVPPHPVAAPVPHPLERYALRLIDLVAPDTGLPSEPAVRSGTSPDPAPGLEPQSRPDLHPVQPFATRPRVQRQLSMPGWLAVVGVPVVLVAAAEAALGELAWLLVLLLHVAILYLCVGLGAFHRQLSELRLLVGAGEEDSARIVLVRWIGAGATGEIDSRSGAAGVRTVGETSQPLARLATAHAILAAYRDVFAPLFWYALLPGAVGPVLYLFARFAACHSYPFARTAYYWLDWIPMRVATLGFALVGQFEDTIFCLKTVGSIRPAVDHSSDPYLHQRLLLLPVAGGALGLQLTDAEVDVQLRQHAPDLDLPGVDPQASSLRPATGLLLRSGVVWTGIYLLAKLLG